MRPAFTLMELIFSMVIVAIVFTVVPKLMFATTKTMEVAIKEDGLFVALALMGDIVRLPWDQNTIDSGGKILDTDAVACTDADPYFGYRLGGFKGSRNCHDTTLRPTPKASFSDGVTYNDIDDFDGYESDLSGRRVDYKLSVAVNYVDDNLKEVNVSVNSSGKTKLCASFFYYSANLGHVQINKRAW